MNEDYLSGKDIFVENAESRDEDDTEEAEETAETVENTVTIDLPETTEVTEATDELMEMIDTDGNGKVQKEEWLEFFGQVYDSVIAPSMGME